MRAKLLDDLNRSIMLPEFGFRQKPAQDQSSNAVKETAEECTIHSVFLAYPLESCANLQAVSLSLRGPLWRDRSSSP